MRLRVIGAIVISRLLVACGGGGSGSSGFVPTTGPSPSATNTPQPSTITGKVVQLSGPLSSSVWNLVAPTNCPSVQSNSPCATYPTPIPTALLPSASAAPRAGGGIAGARVYVTTQQAALTNGLPSSPIVVATTAPDGSFSVTVPASTSSPVGIVVVNGSSISTTTGLTNLGYTVTHADASVGQNVTLPIDLLDGDEQSAITTLNSLLLQTGNKPIVVDTVAQEIARLDAAQEVLTCATAAGNPYTLFGGASPIVQTNVGTIGFDASWAVDIPMPANGTSNTVFAGAAALYQIADCNAGGAGKIANYYDLELIAPY